MRDDIRKGLFEAEAAEAIRKEAFRTYRSVLKEKSLGAYAEENGLVLLTTDPFSRQEGHAAFAEAPDALDEAFSVDSGEMIYPFTTGDSYFVAKVAEKHESHVPPLADVKDVVEATIRQQQQKEAAHKKAKALLATAKEAGSLESVAEREDLEVKNTRLFSRSGRFVPNFGRSSEVMITAFSLTPDNPFPDDVFEHTGKYYVIRLLGREKALQEDFEKKKEELRKKQLKQKQNQHLAAWLDYARAQSHVVVNPKVMQ